MAPTRRPVQARPGAPQRKQTSGALRMLVPMLRGLLALGVGTFSAWMLLYGMIASGLYGLLSAIAIWPQRRLWPAVVLVLLSPVAAGLVGLPEYAAETNTLHCRALGFQGRKAEYCDADELDRGRRAAVEGGHLYSLRERAGVHGFNLLLASGGALAGFPDVARETAAMSWKWASTPAGATGEQRLDQCRASRSEHPVLGAPMTVNSDFPMRSAKVRQMLAAGLAHLGSTPGDDVELGPLTLTGGGTNDVGYLRVLRQDSAAVALALEVPDGHLDLGRAEGGRLLARWRGTIHYPVGDVAFTARIPTIFGTRTLRVSEAVFCGMQVDGAMTPYRLTVQWALSPDDPRLGPERDQSEHAWSEWVVLRLLEVAQ